MDNVVVQGILLYKKSLSSGIPLMSSKGMLTYARKFAGAAANDFAGD